MSADYMDMPRVHTDVQRRARKDHCCDGCAETIRRGDKYLYCSGLWDGRWDDYKYCLRCAAFIDAILSQPGNEGFMHGFSCGHDWEDVFSCAPPDTVAQLAFLTPDEAQRLSPKIGAPRRQPEDE